MVLGPRWERRKWGWEGKGDGVERKEKGRVEGWREGVSRGMEGTGRVEG